MCIFFLVTFFLLCLLGALAGLGALLYCLLARTVGFPPLFVVQLGAGLTILVVLFGGLLVLDVR